MKSKITTKYVQDDFTFKRANSKNSEVKFSKVAPVVDTTVVTTNGNSVSAKNKKYSVTYNKLSGHTEVSKFIASNLTKQLVPKSFPYKNLTLTEDQFQALCKNLDSVENV